MMRLWNNHLVMRAVRLSRRRAPHMLRSSWRLAAITSLLYTSHVHAIGEGMLIKKVEIVGTESVSKPALLAEIHSHEGTPYNPAIVDDDIRTLFARGGYADIRVEREAFGGGVKLTFFVVERPNITAIHFGGNEHLKTKELEEKIGIHTYHALGGEELAKAVATIQELYRKKRFYLVDVDYTLTPSKNGSELTFQIREHGRSGIKRIQFVGNHVFPDNVLKDVIRSKEKGAFLFKRGKLDRDLMEVDLALLARHYLNHGYLKIQLDEPQIEISKDKAHLFVTYHINEGQQYHVGDVHVDGDILTTSDEVRKLIKTKSGDVYNQEQVEIDEHALQTFYGTMGYAFANIQPMPQPNDTTSKAELVFHISKGRRALVDQINIAGNTSTRDKIIRRELQVKEGDLFNRSLVEESRARLMQLGYFESVDIATPRGNRPDSVNLNFTVKERPTGTFNIGAGFSTYENFFFSGSVQKENFFGRGLGGQIAMELSKRRQQYVVSVTNPHFLDTNMSLSLSSGRNIQRFPEYDRKSWSAGLSLGRQFFKHWMGNVGYQWETVNTENFFFSVPDIFRRNATGITSAVTAGVTYDRRDNRITPHKGFMFNVNNEMSGTKLGGDNDFYRVNGAARFYVPVVKDVTLRLFSKAGYVKSLGDRSVPLFERFIMGGPNSLRGYNMWSIGPSTRIPSSPAGGDVRFVYGGNKMLQFNTELEVPLYAPAGFKAVAFVDAGNAFAEDERVSFTNLRANYGFGLRWQSPVGPLRFEWGFPINKRVDEPKMVFNFTIGEFY